MDWRKHWNTLPSDIAEKNFLVQVGKTVGGVPVSDEIVATILGDVRSALDLKPSDTLLDLCCGNGFLTSRLAGNCRTVVGVDFSAPLLDVARKNHAPSNVRYIESAVQELQSDALGEKFDKILMYEALQHFRRDDLSRILENILTVATPSCRILFASVPDIQRRWQFYNTFKRKLDWACRTLRGCEAIGTWWRFETIEKVAQAFGLTAQNRSQTSVLHTAHYRFDALLTRSPKGETHV